MKNILKKVLVVCVIVTVTVLAFGASLTTDQLAWTSLGAIDATAAAADVTFAVTERHWLTAIALDNVVFYEVPSSINALEVRFVLTTNNPCL